MRSPDDAGARLAARISARAAHDLNNVAAVFSGHIYLVRNAAEPVEEAFQAMEKALAHLDRVSCGLAALGGIGMEEPAAVDLNELVREAAQFSGGPVELDLATPLPAARGSGRDLTAALVALLANAREAAGPTAPIHLRTRVEGDRIVVDVEDSGPGVVAAARQRKFDPFFSTKGEKGRGIGLTLAALTAALYNATIAVADRPEGGTRVSIALPATASPKP